MSVIQEMIERAKQRLQPQHDFNQAVREQNKQINDDLLARERSTRNQLWSPITDPAKGRRPMTAEERKEHNEYMHLMQEAEIEARWELDGRQIDPKTGRKLYSIDSRKFLR